MRGWAKGNANRCRKSMLKDALYNMHVFAGKLSIFIKPFTKFNLLYSLSDNADYNKSEKLQIFTSLGKK